MDTNEKPPTLDRAIGDIQRLINICHEPTVERMSAIAAMAQIECAADCLERTERLIRLHLNKDFDKDLHGVMQVSLLKDIEHLMRG